MSALRGPDLIKALVQKGVVPEKTRRVIIDCSLDDFVTVHVLAAVDADAVEVLAASAYEAMVIKESPEPSAPEPQALRSPFDPDEIPF